MTKSDEEIVCDFCGADWTPESGWYWVDLSDYEVVDYCQRCAAALPKQLADLSECGLLQEQ
jgi:hypothetical protein